MEKIVKALLANGFKEGKNPCSEEVEKYWFGVKPGLVFSVTKEMLEENLSNKNYRGSALSEDEVLEQLEYELRKEIPDFKFK